MNNEVKIAIEDVIRLNEECMEINDLDFGCITWTKDGKDLEIDRTVFHNWMFSGLSNMAFILSGVYLTKPPKRIYHYE